jgi:hypothetical protein
MGAFNGSGQFIRSYSWVTDASNGIDITASRVDTEDNGFASGLSLCVTRDGQGAMQTNFVPQAASTYNLGSVSFPWATLYAQVGTFTPPAATQGFTAVWASGTGAPTGSIAIGANLSVPNGQTIAYNLGQLGVVNWAMVNYATSGLWGLTKDAGTTNAFSADLSNNLYGRGIAFCKYKAATTSRNNTTTQTVDPDLQYALPGAGTYRFEFILLINATTTTSKFAWEVLGTPAASGAGNSYIAQMAVGGVAGSSLASALGFLQNTNNVSLASSVDVVTLTGTVQVTGSGVIELTWAQSVAVAANLNLLQGSSLTVTQLS